jgi:hypothetical protein
LSFDTSSYNLFCNVPRGVILYDALMLNYVDDQDNAYHYRDTQNNLEFRNQTTIPLPPSVQCSLLLWFEMLVMNRRHLLQLFPLFLRKRFIININGSMRFVLLLNSRASRGLLFACCSRGVCPAFPSNRLISRELRLSLRTVIATSIRHIISVMYPLATLDLQLVGAYHM